jgi:DNA-binding LacI/PurR family transcriptional regulator
MGVTIKDVAKAANVSPSTVSRVVKDSPRISQETKKRVRQAMRELGYHPNAMAQSLTSKNTGNIGIMLPRPNDEEFNHPFFPEALRGISAVLRTHDRDILFSPAGNEVEERRALQRMVLSGKVDGVVLLSSRISDELITWLYSINFPFVVIGNPRPLGLERICWVDNDNVEIGRMITQYLIDKGYEDIGIITGDLRFVVNIDRLEGYKQAMEAAGKSTNRAYMAEADVWEDGGYNAMLRILRNGKPSAIVTVDDLFAIGAIRACRDRGYSIPYDIGIIGVNNIGVDQYLMPPLTSVEIYAYELGKTAAELLLKRIEIGPEYSDYVIIHGRLVERSSC